MSPVKTALPQTKPVKIMFVDHTAKLSGGEIALLRLISALDRSRVSVSVVLFADGEFVPALRRIGIEPIILPLDVRVLNTRKEQVGARMMFVRGGALRSVVDHVSSLAALISRERPDIVHTNSLKSDIIGGIAARLAGVPVIWHIRDRIAPDYLPRFATWMFRTLIRLIPNYVLANSRATMETLRLPKIQTVSVYNGSSVLYDGIADSEMHVGDAHRRADKVGLIGRISPWKGQHIFIEAAAIVLKERPGTRFEIVGSAMFGEEDYLRSLREKIASLGLEDAIELTGFSNDIPDVLGRLSIFVHASVLPEPFGQTVLEAMAAGVPTIATNAGAIPEIVCHETTGLLVPPGDAVAMANAILRLLDDRQLSWRLASRAREVAREKFDISITAKRIQHIYEYLVGA